MHEIIEADWFPQLSLVGPREYFSPKHHAPIIAKSLSQCVGGFT